MGNEVKDLRPEIAELMEQLRIPGRIIKEAPPPEERARIAQKLQAYFEKVDQRLKDVNEREWDEAVNEAMRHVRRTYQAE